MERLTDHENEHYNQPGCNSCSDYRWRSCKKSGEIDDCIQRLTWLRLLDIEDILGDDYDLDRLRELVKADQEGRCKIIPEFNGKKCGSCRHFKRISGTMRGTCKVRPLVVSRWGGKQLKFEPNQSHLACSKYESALKGEQA